MKEKYQHRKLKKKYTNTRGKERQECKRCDRQC